MPASAPSALLALGVALGALSAACAARRQPSAAAPAALDSLVVERGPCFGGCPVYRVTLTRDGALTVSGGGRQDAVAPRDARALLARAVAAGVLTLPARILGDPALCPVPATDHPTVVLTAYAPGRAARVEHYTGCYASAEPLAVAPAVARLTAVEAEVDALVRGRAPG